MPSPEQQAPDRAAELRELDAAVARAIGWKWVRASGKEEIYVLRDPQEAKEYSACLVRVCDELPAGALPDIRFTKLFSTSADAALAAYEVMRKRGWHLLLFCAAGSPDTGAHATLYKGTQGPDSGVCHGDTFPEALSRAILAAAKQESA